MQSVLSRNWTRIAVSISCWKVEIIDRDEHWRIRRLKESAHMLGYNDPLSKPSIELNIIWEMIIKKCCITMIKQYIYIYINICGNIVNNNDELTHFFRKIYLSHFILERVAKGFMLVMCERGVGDGTGCHILTPSSFVLQQLFFLILLGCLTGVLRAQALSLVLALTTASCPQMELEPWLQLELNSACLKLQLNTNYLWHLVI